MNEVDKNIVKAVLEKKEYLVLKRPRVDDSYEVNVTWVYDLPYLKWECSRNSCKALKKAKDLEKGISAYKSKIYKEVSEEKIEVEYLNGEVLGKKVKAKYSNQGARDSAVLVILDKDEFFCNLVEKMQGYYDERDKLNDNREFYSDMIDVVKNEIRNEREWKQINFKQKQDK